MEIKEHEQIKLNDFNAQLQVIRNNVIVANKELEAALARKDVAQALSFSLDATIAEKRQELQALEKDIESRKASISTREHAAELAEAKNKKDEEDFAQEVAVKLLEIEDRENSANNLILERKNKIDELDKIVALKIEEVKKAEKQAEEAVQTLEGIKGEIKISSDVKSALSEEIDKLNRKLTEDKTQLLSELEQLSRLVEEERVKIETPRAELEKEKAEFDVKMKDYRVLVARLRRFYLELGMEPKI